MLYLCYNRSEICKYIAGFSCYVNTQDTLSQTYFDQQLRKPSLQQSVKRKYAKGKLFESAYLTKKNTTVQQLQQQCEFYLTKLIQRNLKNY